MQHISFYKDRLPFKPRTNLVIYFDAFGIKMKRYYGIIDEYYEEIRSEFGKGGLEFLYLPRIASAINEVGQKFIDMRTLYRYFPQASENDYDKFLNNQHLNDSDLLEYIATGNIAHRPEPGFIQYMGEAFDTESTYTYSFTRLTEILGDSILQQVQQYVKLHGVTDSFFGTTTSEPTASISFCPSPPKRESDSPEQDSLPSIETKRSKREEPKRNDGMMLRQCQRSVRHDRSSGNFSIAREYRHTEPTEAERLEAMKSEVQRLVEHLRRSGVGEAALMRLFKPTKELSRMHIRYGSIFLTDYDNMEIKMAPLSKAVYLLFLRHPEGIVFSYLPDYRPELLNIYSMITGRESMEAVRKSIDDVTDPTRNSINEKCSRIKLAFTREFDESLARNYYITGERGEAKKILLPRDLVTWEMPD